MWIRHNRENSYVSRKELPKEYSKYLMSDNMVGKGYFSRVYDYVGNQVLIVSNCVQKEGLALGFFPETPLYPKLERLIYGGSDYSLYKMAKLNKIVAPKRQLNALGYKRYKLLDAVQKGYDEWMYGRCDNLHVILNEIGLKSKDKELHEAITQGLEAMMNFEGNPKEICFEFSRRNVLADDEGNLVLSDIFFLPNAIEKKLPLRVVR